MNLYTDINELYFFLGFGTGIVIASANFIGFSLENDTQFLGICVIIIVLWVWIIQSILNSNST